MAKKRRRKYSRGSGEEVRREMHRYKRGRAKSGRGGKGGKVKSRKQAIAYPVDERRSSCARSPGIGTSYRRGDYQQSLRRPHHVVRHQFFSNTPAFRDAGSG